MDASPPDPSLAGEPSPRAASREPRAASREPLRVALGPAADTFAADAVRQGGASVVGLGDQPEALVWLDPADMAGLVRVLQTSPQVRWVQLPFAGVEKAVEAGVVDGKRLWTCAKGSYAEPVAEHALALALAGLRHLPQRVTARSWGQPAGTSLFDREVVILGGGGIAVSLLELLRPFRVRATVVRRRAESVPGAHRTVTTTELHQVLPGALVVFLALALTPDTAGIIGAAELAAMDGDAWLVNVARGRHVDTAALVDALRSRSIAGAALDVTDPEPLPERHPLWDLDNCIVTPHTADTIEMVRPLLAARIRDNVERFRRGEPLVGTVDPTAGY